jgi:hypothetical protein
MVRIFSAAVFSTAVLTTWSATAQAAGVGIWSRWTATIRGPELAEPIRFHGKLGPCGVVAKSIDATAFFDDSGLLRAFGDGGHLDARMTKPSGIFGPRYRITTTVRTAEGTVTVRQDLYPYGPSKLSFSSPEAWLYTPPGQPRVDATLGGRWAVSPGLLYVLLDHGFPRITSVDEPDRGEPVPSTPRTPVLPIAVTFVAFGCLVVAVRRTRSRQPAGVH